jgi:hypothetical protein
VLRHDVRINLNSFSASWLNETIIQSSNFLINFISLRKPVFDDTTRKLLHH